MWLPLRVWLGLVVAGLITECGALFAVNGPPDSKEALIVWGFALSKIVFLATGWAWGITLFPRSDEVLRVRETPVLHSTNAVFMEQLSPIERAGALEEQDAIPGTRNS